MALSRTGWVAGVAVFLLQGCGPSEFSEVLPREVDFNYHVRPILSNNCYVCHGPDVSTREAELRLDTFEGATARREGGRAIVPGDPKRSLLIRRVSSHDLEQRMPPAETNKVLTEREVALLARWIDQGAEYKTHWAFLPRESVEGATIDALVNEQLDARGLTAGPPAARETLIRRASYVLTGLPPEPAAVHAFVEDEREDAYEHVVDALLDSPRFGERWARHWMDLVRYADSKGHEFDFTIHGAWRYRDYLIRAFNADVPYDQLVTEHLAGDLVAQPRIHPDSGYNESVLGTAFFFLGEGKHSPVDTRIDEAERIDNIIDVTTKTFQGVTVACARCHDHKFDPIPTTDYYSLYGIVESARFAPTPILSAAHQTVLDSLKAAQDMLRREVAEAWLEAPSSESGELLPARVAAAPDSTSSWIWLGDFRDGGSDGWFGHGPAFDAGPARGLPVGGGRRLDSLTAGVVSSRRLGKGIPGAWRSPTFTIDHDTLTILAAGYQSAIRIVIDNFQLIRAPIHGGLNRELKSDTLVPYRFDMGLWKGRKAYVEFLVGRYAMDGTVTEQHELVLDRDSWFDAAWVIAHNEAAPNIPDRRRAQASLAQAIEAWAKGQASAEHVAAINLNIRNGTLERPGLKPHQDRVNRLREQLGEIPFFMGMAEGDYVASAVFGRGNYTMPTGDPVPHRFLSALDPSGTPFERTASGRLELAQAIVDPANPLTARVMVNRLWHYAFGRGIVKTVDNLGAQGELPSNPALLDYVAQRLIEHDWSIKATLREIMLSDVFQRTTVPPEGVFERDPNNLYLSHYPVRRLEGEAIRDALLAVAGQLDSTMYGPPVPIYLTDFMEGRGRPQESGPLDGTGRRSVYIAVRRNFLSPMMLAFDTPIPFSTFGARNSSNVPAQSLIMLNDPIVAAMAERWGESVAGASSPAMEDRIAAMYWRALSRAPTPGEVAEAMDFLHAEADQAGVEPRAILERADLWASLGHVIFNLKEFIYLV